MNRDEAFERINKVFREVFDDEGLNVNDATTSSDIDGWDSLMHISLVSEIEDEFNVHFSMKDIAQVSNVGEMIDLILGLVR